MFRRFSVPEYIHDPITFAIIQQLKTVDASGEGFRIIRIVAGFVGTPNLNNITELFLLIMDGVLKETVRSHSSAAARNIIINRKQDGIGVSRLCRSRGHCNSRDETCTRDKQGPHSIPVARLPFGAGNHVVHRVQNGFEAISHPRIWQLARRDVRRWSQRAVAMAAGPQARWFAQWHLD